MINNEFCVEGFLISKMPEIGNKRKYVSRKVQNQGYLSQADVMQRVELLVASVYKHWAARVFFKIVGITLIIP
jgi:hypothetical protein